MDEVGWRAPMSLVGWSWWPHGEGSERLGLLMAPFGWVQIKNDSHGACMSGGAIRRSPLRVAGVPPPLSEAAKGSWTGISASLQKSN